MKKFTILLSALLMLSLSVMAQIKMYLHFNDGTRVEYIASRVDSITFDPQIQEPDDSETPDGPILPDYEDPKDKEDDPVKPDDKEENDDPIKPGDDPVYDGSFVAKSFSVSETKTVTFSPGNLQYHPANYEWRFAPNQTDYIGGYNENISSTYNGWIDLFGWGTGNNPTKNSTDNSDYQTFVDWGVNKIGSYAPNTWRTLTYDEWYYLRWKRPNYDKLISVAQVNGVSGLILLPDDWTCPIGVTFKSGLDGKWCTECYGYYQTFSASDWSKLESSGAVFFPTAGNSGSYWSATEEYIDKLGDKYALMLRFYSHQAAMSEAYHSSALSVRLVQDNNNQTDDEDTEDDSEKDPIKPDDSTDSFVNANGHEYVDLGLPSGLLWATMNVGAESPEDYGDYFAWGETEPKDYYYWDTYKWMTDGASSGSAVNKYTFDDGQTSAVWYDDYGNFIGDNKTVLELADDAANANWGGDWRMPTKAEQDELRNTSYTTWTWTTLNGVNGYKITSKINGNSIFLPAAGCRYYSDLDDAGSNGYYWSSSLYMYSSNYAYYLYFSSDNFYWFYYRRYYGQSVRPVLRVE